MVNGCENGRARLLLLLLAESGGDGARRGHVLQVHGGAGPLRAALLVLQGQDGRQPALVARQLQEGRQGQVVGEISDLRGAFIRI